MITFTLCPKTFEVKVFRTLTDANAYAAVIDDETKPEDLLWVFSKVEEVIADKSLTTAKIVSAIAALATLHGVAARKSFKNKTEAAEELFSLLDGLKPAGKPDGAKPAADKAERRGRASPYEGKRIFPSAAVAAENPRHFGGVGYTLLEAVRAKPGMSWEEYKVLPGAAGIHLKWDLERGHVTLK